MELEQTGKCKEKGLGKEAQGKRVGERRIQKERNSRTSTLLKQVDTVAYTKSSMNVF